MPPTTHRRKLTQKELRAPDEFTSFVDNARDFFVNNLTQMLVSAAVVVVVGAIVIGVYYYERHRDSIASARFYDAITALNAGQNKPAETQFKQLADEEPSRRLGRLARFYLASAYLADGDLPNARDSLVAFLAEERDPLFRSLALTNLAVVYERMADWKKAAERLSAGGRRSRAGAGEGGTRRRADAREVGGQAGRDRRVSRLPQRPSVRAAAPGRNGIAGAARRPRRRLADSVCAGRAPAAGSYSLVVARSRVPLGSAGVVVRTGNLTLPEREGEPE